MMALPQNSEIAELRKLLESLAQENKDMLRRIQNLEFRFGEAKYA